MTEIVKAFGDFGLFFVEIMAIVFAVCGLYFLLKVEFFKLIVGKKPIEGVDTKSLYVALAAMILAVSLCVFGMYYRDTLKQVKAELVSNDVPVVPIVSESQPMENN